MQKDFDVGHCFPTTGESAYRISNNWKMGLDLPLWEENKYEDGIFLHEKNQVVV